MILNSQSIRSTQELKRFFFFFFFDKYGVQESSSKVTPENTKQVVGEILHFMNQNLQS
jgi:hypothetical protein